MSSNARLTIEAALADPTFRKHALMVGSTGVAAAQMRRAPLWLSILTPRADPVYTGQPLQPPSSSPSSSSADASSTRRSARVVVGMWHTPRTVAEICNLDFFPDGHVTRELREFLIGNEITTILIDEKSMISQQDMAWRQRRM